jgi:hypothetical protein
MQSPMQHTGPQRHAAVRLNTGAWYPKLPKLIDFLYSCAALPFSKLCKDSDYILDIM